MYRISSKKLKEYISLSKSKLEYHILKPLGYCLDEIKDIEFVTIKNKEIELLYTQINLYLKPTLDHHNFLPKNTRCNPNDGFYDFSLLEKEFRLFSQAKKDKEIIHLVQLYFFLKEILKDESDYLRMRPEKVRGIRRREKYFISSKMLYTYPGLNVRLHLEKKIIGNKLFLKTKFYAISDPIDFYFPKEPRSFSRKFISIHNNKNEYVKPTMIRHINYLPDRTHQESRKITVKDYHEYIHECTIEKEDEEWTKIHMDTTTYTLKNGEEYYLTIKYSNKFSNRLKIVF